MKFDEYVQGLRKTIEGDSFVRLLRSNLESGSEILKVSFVDPAPGSVPIYRFLLSRLGTLSEVSVPAGSEAIERLLTERRLKQEKEEDEVKRSAWRFRMSFQLWTWTLPLAEVRAVLRTAAMHLGAPISAGLPAESSELFAAQSKHFIEVAQVHHAFAEQVISLHLDTGYELGQAASIADRGLARLITTSGWATASPG